MYQILLLLTIYRVCFETCILSTLYIRGVVMSILVKVGTNIRRIRKSKGLSQEKLGELCNFTFSYIGGVERAEKNISLINLEKIATALNVDTYEFFVNYSDIQLVSDKNDKLKKLVNLMLHKSPKEIQKAENVLKEIFE